MKRYKRIELCPDYFSWDEAMKLVGDNIPICMWRDNGKWVIMCDA